MVSEFRISKQFREDMVIFNRRQIDFLHQKKCKTYLTYQRW